MERRLVIPHDGNISMVESNKSNSFDFISYWILNYYIILFIHLSPYKNLNRILYKFHYNPYILHGTSYCKCFYTHLRSSLYIQNYCNLWKQHETSSLLQDCSSKPRHQESATLSLPLPWRTPFFLEDYCFLRFPFLLVFFVCVHGSKDSVIQ